MDDMLKMLLDSAMGATKQLAASSDSVKRINADSEASQAELIKQTALAGTSDGKGGRETAIMTEAQDRADLMTQRNNARAATAMGTNMNDSSEIITELSTRWKEATLNADNARKELEGKMAVKFADNPGQWVINQFTMGDSINAADEYGARAEQLGKAISTAQANTQSIAVTNNILAEKKTEASVQSHLEAVQAQIKASVASVKIQNAGINIQGIKDLDSITVQELNVLGTAESAITQQKHLAIAQAQFAQTSKMNALMIEDRQERIAEKKADRAELESRADVVRKGLSTMGFKDLSVAPAAKIDKLLQQKNGIFVDAELIGMNSDSAGRPILADNPGDVARIINTHNAQLVPGQENIRAAYKDAWQEALTPEAAKAGKYDNTKLVSVANAAGGFTVAKATSDMSNIKHGDRTNIYAPPPLKSVLSLPEIQKTALYQKVLETQMKTGALQEFNPEQLKDFTLGAIKSGVLSYPEAVKEYAGLINAARVTNNKYNNYVGLGLPVQSKYPITAESNFGTTRKYNLADTSEVSLYFATEMQKASRSSVPDVNATNPNF